MSVHGVSAPGVSRHLFPKVWACTLSKVPWAVAGLESRVLLEEAGRGVRGQAREARCPGRG